MSELVDKVRTAIGREQLLRAVPTLADGLVSYQNNHPGDDPDARAAIATVFDWLASDPTNSREFTRSLAERRKAAMG